MRLTPLKLLIAVLLLLGIGIPLYKIQVLGFSLDPSARVETWTVEAAIAFEADGGPVTVMLNAPDNAGHLTFTGATDITPGYTSKIEEIDGVRRLVWRSVQAEGPQRLYYRVNAFLRKDRSWPIPPIPPPDEREPRFADAYLVAADAMIAAAREATDSVEAFCRTLIDTLNQASGNDQARLLLEMPRETGGSVDVLRDLVRHAGIPARVTRGVFLADKPTKNQKAQTLLEVDAGQQRLLLNPVTAEREDPDRFLLWERGGESLFEVVGGQDSKLRFSTLRSTLLANIAAIEAGKDQRSLLIDFSIYSLPLDAQNTFKLLLLIPFGALVVVILRNLVGIRTSGTFMPILIALVFLQTKLLAGLVLFVLVVSVGLILRSFLSRMNLLLVPRISAVLVMVITIYLALAVLGHKLGTDIGLQVTFFPMIIISWTIERMSILWEEEGPKEVVIQGGGSLFTASMVYLLLLNPFLGHLTYSFPELLLALLAVILLIGSYTGYRLTELRRFEPMVRED